MPTSANDRGRVWILEDSALEAELARRALSRSQNVELFSDGSVVLERAMAAPLPDVIVLDRQLPGISGVEVCRVLRASHDAMTLPIVMLTVFGQKEDILEALEAGANDYVTKPYDVTELIARVGTLVNTSRLHRSLYRRARQLSLSAEVGAAVTRGKDLREVAKRSVAALEKELDATAVEIWAKAKEHDELTLVARNDSPGFPDALVRRVGEAREPFVTDDPKSVSELAEREFTGFAALPLVVRDELLGVLLVGTSHPVGDAGSVLATIADLLAIGTARARVEGERVVLLERERNARAEAEAANRSKDDFLAMVSHELRTPLNAITGWASMLAGGTLDASKTQRALEIIERNARSQVQLVDDLLDISRIISGKLRVNVATVDLPTVAEMAVESVRLAAETKNVGLSTDVDVTAGSVSGDPDRLQQVMWNLLSNAIKFTPRGGTVSLRLRRTARGIETNVSDTGQGISPDFLPHIFERFKQADGTITRMKGGLGLGLAIVKNLVEIHGGTVEATSEGTGRGATFCVVLPTSNGDDDARRAHAPFPSAARLPSDRPREIEGLRVLVVDDELDARELIRMLLESCKVHVATAASAEEAFAAVRTTAFDVLISDIAMPGEDGFSLIRRVRALPRESGGRVHAVALTAYARLEDRTRALRAGFNSHVAKPVEASELLAVLSSLAHQR